MNQNGINQNDTNQKQLRLQNRARIRQLAGKVLDGLDRALDQMKQPPVERLPLAVARRQAANALRLWTFCAEAKCKRRRCCRGEPLHCLGSVLPLVAPDALIDLIERKRPRHKRGRRVAAQPRPRSPA